MRDRENSIRSHLSLANDDERVTVSLFCAEEHAEQIEKSIIIRVFSIGNEHFFIHFPSDRLDWIWFGFFVSLLRFDYLTECFVVLMWVRNCNGKPYFVRTLHFDLANSLQRPFKHRRTIHSFQFTKYNSARWWWWWFRPKFKTTHASTSPHFKYWLFVFLSFVNMQFSSVIQWQYKEK